MTHLPYLVAAYGITVVSIGTISIHSWTRLQQIKKKLAQLQDQNKQP